VKDVATKLIPSGVGVVKIMKTTSGKIILLSLGGVIVTGISQRLKMKKKLLDFPWYLVVAMLTVPGITFLCTLLFS
jgi:hypothetical protein